MKRATRLILLVAAAGTALAIAGPAGATINTAKLNITTQPGLGATGPVTIEVSQAATDDPLAHISIYTGVGYTANLTAASGTQLGTATASVQSLDLGATVPVAGTVQARAANGTYLSGGVQIPLAAASMACTQTAAHAAFWVIALSAAGQSLEVPLFVDPTAGAETAFAAYKIQACFPAPDLQAGDPRRAPLGLKLLDAKLILAKVFTNPTTAGTPIWSAFFTPYNPGLGTANPAGTVESRSATAVPATISLKATYDKKRKAAVLRGVITVVGQPLAGLAVPIYSGSKLTNVKAAGRTTKSTTKGVFGAVKKILKTTYFQVGGILGGGDLTATLCPAFPSLAPGGCVSATTGQIPLFSKVVKVVVPKKK